MPSTHVLYRLHHKHFFPHLFRPNNKTNNETTLYAVFILIKKKKKSIHKSIISNLEPMAPLGQKCYLYSRICKYFMTMVVSLLTIDDRCIKVLSGNIHLCCRIYINWILQVVAQIKQQYQSTSTIKAKSTTSKVSMTNIKSKNKVFSEVPKLA